jgi:N-acetylneuraminate synthase
MNKFNRKYPYIIAEIGANHNGDIEIAKELINEAKHCGCDAVKFQLWNKDTAHTNEYIKKLNKIKKTIDGAELSSPILGLKNAEEQLEKFSFGRKEHVILREYAYKKKIDFSSTCLTFADLDFLVKLKVDFLKIASQDLDHILFIEHIAKKKLPTILSTGLGTFGEIDDAVRLFKKKDNLTLLHCISLYPPYDYEIHLNQMIMLKKLFNVNVGYSDHAIGTSISLAAAALGAKVIEKHFTLDKNLPGWDHYVSANPEEMKFICKETKKITLALGDSYHSLNGREINKKVSFRRSIISAVDIKKGQKISLKHLDFKRPAIGISPNNYNIFIGRVAKKNIKRDTTLKISDFF